MQCLHGAPLSLQRYSHLTKYQQGKPDGPQNANDLHETDSYFATSYAMRACHPPHLHTCMVPHRSLCLSSSRAMPTGEFMISPRLEEYALSCRRVDVVE